MSLEMNCLSLYRPYICMSPESIHYHALCDVRFDLSSIEDSGRGAFYRYFKTNKNPITHFQFEYRCQAAFPYRLELEDNTV
jgi:hypothetical protein